MAWGSLGSSAGVVPPRQQSDQCFFGPSLSVGCPSLPQQELTMCIKKGMRLGVQWGTVVGWLLFRWQMGKSYSHKTSLLLIWTIGLLWATTHHNKAKVGTQYKDRDSVPKKTKAQAQPTRLTEINSHRISMHEQHDG